LFYNKELARFHDLSYHHAAFEAADEPPYLAPPDAPF